jgi:hypothetical protein
MTANEVTRSTNGMNGFEFITDTQAHAGNFVKLQIITTTVIAAYTALANAPVTGNTLTGVSIPAGTIIGGRFSSITLTSGSLIAYKG